MKKAPVLVVLVFAGAVAGHRVPAGATCTTGEICFYKNDDGGGAVYETISRAQAHANLKFSDGTAVRNNVDSVANRDTSCNIKVVDDRGIYPDDWQTIPNTPSRTKPINLIGSVSNQNDRHEKGGC